MSTVTDVRVEELREKYSGWRPSLRACKRPSAAPWESPTNRSKENVGLRAENRRLRAENKRLRAENVELRAEIARLRAMLRGAA